MVHKILVAHRGEIAILAFRVAIDLEGPRGGVRRGGCCRGSGWMKRAYRSACETGSVRQAPMTPE